MSKTPPHFTFGTLLPNLLSPHQERETTILSSIRRDDKTISSSSQRVPVIRDADSLTLAEIEDQIGQYGVKAKNAQLSIDEMTGGTFTISNGGVFGSMLSTPILNPPQTAILGMHKIQDRPMAIDGEVVIRPMMYLALSYDHRLIDGQEAVRFLVTVKDFLEEPARILLDI